MHKKDKATLTDPQFILSHLFYVVVISIAGMICGHLMALGYDSYQEAKIQRDKENKCIARLVSQGVERADIDRKTACQLVK